MFGAAGAPQLTTRDTVGLCAAWPLVGDHRQGWAWFGFRFAYCHADAKAEVEAKDGSTSGVQPASESLAKSTPRSCMAAARRSSGQIEDDGQAGRHGEPGVLGPKFVRCRMTSRRNPGPPGPRPVCPRLPGTAARRGSWSGRVVTDRRVEAIAGRATARSSVGLHRVAK